MVHERMERPWLQTVDNLIALQHRDSLEVTTCAGAPSDYAERLDAWRRFGIYLGLDETSVRLPVRETGLEGCSWHRCPLHEVFGGVIGRDFMACTSCYSVRGLKVVLSPPFESHPFQSRSNIVAFIAKNSTQASLSLPISYANRFSIGIGEKVAISFIAEDRSSAVASFRMGTRVVAVSCAPSPFVPQIIGVLTMQRHFTASFYSGRN